MKHGIKLAGMPAFGPTHSDEEIWGIVAFLERLEGMTEEDYARWQSLYSQGPAGSAATSGGHEHEPETGPAFSLTGGSHMRWTMLSLVFAAFPAALAAQATDAAREAEVRSAMDVLHTALAAGDSTAALQWLHADVVIYESGHAETLSEYRSGHLGSDMAFASATRREVTSESINVWGDQALYLSESRTRGQFRGREIDSHGTETAVLIRTPEGWRIRHIHWSSGR